MHGFHTILSIKRDYSINQMIFVIEQCGVFSEVWAEFLKYYFNEF
jgi:hypothetical protein